MAVNKNQKEQIADATGEVELNLKEHNEKLQEELNQLKAMMLQFMESQKAPPQNNAIVNTTPSDMSNLDEDIAIISPNKMVQVTSLFYGGMTLKGNNDKPIRYEKFGVTLPISYDDLTHISSKHRNLAEEGAFFIHNKDVIRSLYLEENYKNFLTKEKIENILELSENEIRRLLTNTTDQIRETVYDVVYSGVVKHLTSGDHKYSDLNKISIVSEICGKNDIYRTALEQVKGDKQ